MVPSVTTGATSRRAGSHRRPSCREQSRRWRSRSRPRTARRSPTPSSPRWRRWAGAFEIGQLSKAKEDWVLVTTARIDGKLHGFTFSHARAHRRHAVRAARPDEREAHLQARRRCCKGLMGEAYHRALMAFPDEDVVVGTRFVDRRRARGVQGRSTTSSPAPATRPSARSGRGAGAWPSASASTATYDEQTFIVKANGAVAASSTTSRSSPRRSSPTSSRCSPSVDAEPGRRRWSPSAGPWPRTSLKLGSRS